MRIEICVEYKRKVIFAQVFDTGGRKSFREFREDFYHKFALRHPRIFLQDVNVRETWRPLDKDRILPTNSGCFPRASVTINRSPQACVGKGEQDATFT